ncbi:unnamed protein product, partial [Allacma fusca]
MSQQMSCKLPENTLAIVAGGSLGLAGIVYLSGQLKNCK